ncbi:MAG: hypothetical protein OER77_08160 [Myxococcales bacterium]|nr:hypothetical protein [Myxococcales bacterium]
MKRAAILVGIFAALGVVAGFLVARLTTNVIPTMKEQRSAGPTRMVPKNWPQVRLSPGHSQHIINEPVECDECHDPAEEGFGSPDTGVCTQCHEEQASLAHVNLDGMPMDCYTCHVFGAEPEVFGRWHCTRCHGPFESEGLEGLAMHATVPCESCHNPHKPAEETIRECDECHQKMNVQHGRSRLSGSCADCHGGHKLASDAASCMECHATEKPKVPASATFGDGHDSCATCHEAHSFSASTALRCTSCHEDTRVLASNRAPEHRECGSCHEPHAVRPAGDRACRDCHDDVRSTHPVEHRQACVGCHDPHPKRLAQGALRCSQCHDEARSDRAFHAGKIPCVACHEPHRFDLSRLSDRAMCGRCHTLQIRLTRRNLGHSTCKTCHEGTTHEPAGVVACGSCHDEQLSKSPKGHRECATCHEPHGGTVSAQAKCNACHKVAQLPGLHRIADVPQGEGHSECTACHDIHEAKVRADRADCMTCHEDVADHEPDAKRCTGCHTFIRGR